MMHLKTRLAKDPESSEAPVPQNMERIYNKVKHCAETHFMRTPCRHDYHIDCLLGWMKVKMECPTCRRELPSLN